MGRMNDRLTCMAYVIPVIYFFEQLILKLQVIIEPFGLEYVQLIIVISVLHFTEGMLTFFFGSRRSRAVITYMDNEIAGGYQSYGRWILPLLIFSINGIYVPILTGIVYFNETFTKGVEEKAQKMGIVIALYGIAIMGIHYFIKQGTLSLMLAMILIPALHELMMIGDRLYEKGKALYTYPKKGIRLMAFEKAANMPKPFEWGDIILEINNKPIDSEEDYEAAMVANYVLVHLLKTTGDELYVVMKKTQLQALSPVFLPRK